jgi:Ribosome inactivating protein
MNNQNYRDMVMHAIEALPGATLKVGLRWIKQLPPAAAPAVPVTLQFPAGDARQGMQIFYRRHDAYIMGYRTTHGQNYACNNQMANIPAPLNLGFNDDYATLGWNRQGSAVNTDGGPKVTVADLDQALTSASNGAVSRIQLCRIVLALAEGIRFDDVEKAVRAGSAINTTMVDWAQQLVNGNAVLRQG